jgi:hypothetical protein
MGLMALLSLQKKKKVMLRIFIALKNSLLSARFEPTNLGSNGKYYNHYTAENTTTITYFANNLHNLDSNKVTPISVRHYYHEERKKFCSVIPTTQLRLILERRRRR